MPAALPPTSRVMETKTSPSSSSFRYPQAGENDGHNNLQIGFVLLPPIWWEEGRRLCWVEGGARVRKCLMKLSYHSEDLFFLIRHLRGCYKPSTVSRSPTQLVQLLFVSPMFLSGNKSLEFPILPLPDVTAGENCCFFSFLFQPFLCISNSLPPYLRCKSFWKCY